MEKIIRVKSSSGNEIYNVTFKFDQNLARINCDCQTGLVKMLCKHRLNLWNEDFSALAFDSDIVICTEVIKNICKLKFFELFSELNGVESEIKKLDTLRKKLKKDIGLKVSNGF